MADLLPVQRVPASVPGKLGLAAKPRGGYGRAARVLVAGNQAALRRVLADHYDVIAARTGQEVLALSPIPLLDACILDLALPDMDGIGFIAELRRRCRAPVIALSSRTGRAYEIGALEAGADQYVAKPFTIDEVLARLRALLRRASGDVIRSRHPPVIGRWQLDVAARTVTRAGAAPPSPACAGTPRLTPTEWAILEELLRNPGQLVAPARLMTSVWGPGFEGRTSNLRFHMTHLRRKLEDDPACPRYLLTEHGMGYRYQPGSSVPSGAS